MKLKQSDLIGTGACTITIEEYRRREKQMDDAGGPKHHVLHQPHIQKPGSDH